MLTSEEVKERRYKNVGLRPDIYLKLVSITPKNITYSDKIDELIKSEQQRKLVGTSPTK